MRPVIVYGSEGRSGRGPWRSPARLIALVLTSAVAAAVLVAWRGGPVGRRLDLADALRREGLRTTLERSVALYERAARDDRATAAERARALLGRGIALTWLTRPRDALPILQEARGLLQRTGHTGLEAEALAYEGLARRYLSDHTESLRAIREAIELARRASDRRVEALALTGLGWATEGKDRPTAEEKRAALEAAIRIQRELSEFPDLSLSLSGLGLLIQGLSEKDGARSALPIYEEALAVARAGNAGRAVGQAMSLMGYAYSQMGDIDKSLAAYEQSLPFTRRAGHRIQIPYTADGIARIYHRRGRFREALSYFELTLAVWEELDQRQAIGYSLNNVGVMHSELGDRETAARYYRRALDVHRANGDAIEEATTTQNLGSILMEQGNPNEGLALIDQGLEIYRAHRDRRRIGAGLRARGMTLFFLGRYREAVEAYSEAVEISRIDGHVEDEILGTRWLGMLLGHLGHATEALRQLHATVTLAERRNLPVDLAGALAQMARVQLDLGQPDAARQNLDRALRLVASGELPGVTKARVLEALGDWALHTGRPEQAVDYLEQAVAARGAGGRVDLAMTYVKVGEAYRAHGNRAAALDWYLRATTESQAARAPAAEALVLVELMRLSASGGELGAAAFYGKQAVNHFQQVRDDLRSMDYALQRAFIDARSQIYRDLADILISGGRLPEAQQVLDLLKQQEFFDFIRRSGPNPSTDRVALTALETASLTEYQRIALETIALGRQRHELRRIVSRTTQEEARLDDVERELSRRNERFAVWLAGVSREFKRRGATTDWPFTIREAQPLTEIVRELGHGTVTLYTLAGPERYRVVLITPDAWVAGEYPITEADLNRKIMAFRQVLENPLVDPRPLGQELYTILVGPVAPALARAGARTLMWSLDGALRYLSIPALHDGRQYLAERYRSVMFTPASRDRLRDLPAASWSGLGFGVSRAVGEFSPLPAVADELKAIFRQSPGSPGAPLEGRVLLDEHFTERTFRSALRERRQVVHIATHFRFQPGNETDSFLLLGDGTRLTLAELRHASSPFEGVELLALSACNTAVSGGDGSGTEVEGFAVIAQQQGARAVLASLWAVADASTRTFMQEFYRARVAGGLSKAEALQQAQLALLRGTHRVEATTVSRGLTVASAPGAFTPPAGAPYAHPYFWAPFILIGNWR